MQTLAELFAEEEAKLDEARAAEKAAEQAEWDAMTDEDRATWKREMEARQQAWATDYRDDGEDDFDTDEGDFDDDDEEEED